jgi:DMSO/TMAO reductase YedYZ molybdopterin-dependent catalytic subunit
MKTLTRRTLITAGVATVAGGAAARYGLIPPDRGTGIMGIEEMLTYNAQRLLTSSQALAREFPRDRISKVHPVNGLPPTEETYQRLAADGFKDWRLSVEGMVARPTSFSLDDLKRMPAESRIILHACEEGWSYIAEWTGVRLSHVLEAVGTAPQARYAVFTPYENVNQNTGAKRVLWDSIDMVDALHPQTLLAYGMNGEDLAPGHGAPLRLRTSRQLGYKNTKFLHRLVLTDDMEAAHDPARRGPWYGGI